MRIGAVILCLILALKDCWPKILKAYLPLFWYFTVCYCLPFFVTYHFVQNPSSTSFSLNFILALFWLIAVLDWASFALVLPMGVVAAYAVHITQGGTLYYSGFTILGMVINVAWVIVTSLLFIRKKNNSYQETIQRMKMLAGSIAHELRTPLSAIQMDADALSHYLPYYEDAYAQAKEANLTSPKIHVNELENIGSIPQNLQSLIHNAHTMINMLLTNFNEGTANRKAEQCSMKDCVEEALNTYPFSLNERELVHWHTTADFFFLGHKEFTKHIIFNLIKNALYAITSVGKGEIYITIEQAEADKNKGRLIFKDTGPGIAAQSLPHIFDRFYTKTRHGTGIGLAFCQSVIRGFGGEIECSSQLGDHTTFTISLPVIKKEEQVKMEFALSKLSQTRS